MKPDAPGNGHLRRIGQITEAISGRTESASVDAIAASWDAARTVDFANMNVQQIGEPDLARDSGFQCPFLR